MRERERDRYSMCIVSMREGDKEREGKRECGTSILPLFLTSNLEALSVVNLYPPENLQEFPTSK